ncbi:phosphoribosyl-ATP diphosphatase [Acetobacter fabarum]|uniref:phosphoribosyl-ATP diphosphatase n=1 Tax=Acetobacter fabarum TaxID=483199 RepID=UPI00312BB148
MIKKAPSKATAKAETKTIKAKKAKAAETPELPPQSDGADASVLNRLYDVVQSRKNADPAVSHSARLLSRGTYKIAQKFGEEAVECLIEAVAGRTNLLVGESADVLYHLIVMWVNAGITPDEVWAELARREGTSGIAEKASRPKVSLPTSGSTAPDATKQD